MSEQDKSVPIGRVKSDDPRMVYRTQFSSIEELIERLAPAVYDWGLLVRDTGEHAEGDLLQFAIILADGRQAIRARARVRKSDKLPAGRMALRFTAMDPRSKEVWVRMQQLRGGAVEPAATADPTPPPAGDSTPAPSGGPAAPAGPPRSITPGPTPAVKDDEAAACGAAVSQQPPAREELDQALRRMVLLDEDAEVAPAPGAAETGEQKKTEGPVLGIDLGTTNSCCAIVKKDKPFVIPSRRGHNTIPSVVAIDPMGDTVVGHAARAQMEINPERTIYGSKRLVGRPFDSPVVRQVCDRFHYEIVAGPNNDAAVRIDDKLLSLEEVASLILTEIKDTAQEFLGGYVERAVVTVPAFYNENQRQAVRKAGELAGFQVERILNEPTAAALTFGVKSQGDRRLLVYDLGGGTFDATLLELKGDSYEVLSTGGDTFLGGVDFDAQLMDHILIEFQLQLGKMPQMDRVAYLRVLQGAEFAKRSLSSKQEAQVRLPFIGRVDDKPVDLDVTVGRDTLQELCQPMVQRTLDVCEAVLAQRSVRPEDVDDILLVGGQTRMPMIWEQIQALFGKEPLKGVHPDESVAIGAALLGHSIDQEAAFELVDVLPISIGVGSPGGVFRKVIAAGTALPAGRTYGLYTYVDNQANMVIPIYQGESNQVDESELLGVVELDGIPPGKAGSRMIEITFGLTPECLLTVSAKERDGTKLADVKLSAQESTENLLTKLAAVSARAELAAELAAEKEAEPQDQPGAGAAPRKGGFWAWLKGLFGKQ